MNVYTPKIVESISTRAAYATMLVLISRCPICNEWMIQNNARYKSPFPHFRGLNFSAQVEAAGWKYAGYGRGDELNICKECSDNGLATFTCALCEVQQRSDCIHARIGDPPEFLCKNCYETIPAKI